MKVEEGMTLDIYTTSVIPIGAMFVMTLWLGSTAYMYISVAFAQMLKSYQYVFSKLNYPCIAMCLCYYLFNPFLGANVHNCSMPLFIPWIFLELPKMNAFNGPWSFQPPCADPPSIPHTESIGVPCHLTHKCIDLFVSRELSRIAVVLLSALLFAGHKANCYKPIWLWNW
ncbi:hypothetical protein IFM89_023974 [Coptis chinensis]|uniref:Uncharacterized protein n=1 Tax=Coptis chinensis TaxID=261450 RepID=A0A835HJJ8_9MAGN|nr:hypothetical protein IFM89_023974 [Coptis chinensis]